MGIHWSKNIKKLCEDIIDEANYKEEVILHLRDKISNLQKDLEDKTYKDKEMQRLKKERDEAIQDMRRGFPISKEEYDKVHEWMREHEVSKHPQPEGKWRPRGGAIGGSYRFIFTPTSIGVFGAVKCSCGEEFCFQEEA